MAKVTRSTSNSDAENHRNKKKTGQIASKRQRARVYESVIEQSPVQEADAIWRDVRNRWGAPTEGPGTSVAEPPQEGEGAMKFIVAVLALLASDAALAQVQNRTYQDSMGRNTGRSVTDSRGNTTYYNSMGRNTGRSTTRGNTTTIYDSMGRQTGTIRR